MDKRVLLVALVILMATSAFPQTPQRSAPMTVPELVKRTTNAVVQIVASDDTGQQTLGSGFVVSQDGTIVTNFHVIEDANSAIAKFANGSFLPVQGILAQDGKKDLVILKVDGRNLESLSLDSTSALQVGDHVVAIGNPLGLGGTVSDGIVSAIRSDEEGKTWIQTTAPVSHGNSGGPLLNMHGKVVGVITRGVNPEEGQNLNFAIPAFEVAQLLWSDWSISPLGNDCTSIAKEVNNVVQPPGDISESLWKEHLEKAKQGDADAQLWLTLTYWGRANDARADVASTYFTRAAYWKCRTAVQGDVAAQDVLGEIFRDGNGVETDYAKAEKWFLASAEQGYATGQLDLGLIYMDFQDYAEADFWLSVGLTGPEPDFFKRNKEEDSSWKVHIESLRKKRDEAAAHLSTAQLAQVQERVRKWSEEEHKPRALVH